MEQVNDAIKAIIENQSVANNLKVLRNACAKGSNIQEFLADCEVLQDILNVYLFSEPDNNSQLHSMAWQLLANATVNNPNSQRIIWLRHGDDILNNFCKPPLGRHTDIQLMIIYNVLRGGSSTLTEADALLAIIQLWKTIINEKFGENLDFLHFLYEHYIVEGGRRTVNCLMQLKSEERIIFLDYLASYIRHDSPNGLVHSFLLQHISKEFKMKSDCVLRQLTTQVEESHPREVYALLRIIATATGSEKYEKHYARDHALFLNVSSLLRCLVSAGKETQNMFTPMSKLEEVAPTSRIGSDFESEISYEMKTLLVRCCANLLYKNEVNKNYCLDTQVMPALFECTNMDARNPLMKEWSILAIRNACIDCPEIQDVVANLTKQGMAKNDIVEELNLEMGALRIQPHRE